MPSDDGERLKRRMQRRMKREDGGRPVIGELQDTNWPEAWDRRVEKLYRVHVLPRLEAKARREGLTEIEKQVMEKGKAFLLELESRR